MLVNQLPDSRRKSGHGSLETHFKIWALFTEFLADFIQPVLIAKVDHDYQWKQNFHPKIGFFDPIKNPMHEKI